MGQYELTMSKSDPEKAPVFLVRFKDGSYAIIQFTRLKRTLLDERKKLASNISSLRTSNL